ncbi:SDR family NAD(P)-dependent oxidoreductase [Novosphingobium piscinae]|uniref:SDR family NAD(P)-dependent oxidoreductase n=1 Tax=Novosphingobium piscinae TaxID=1507448 RepID=A0A7X1FVV1_9SPHN|nr:SDR family NAD(P)-dependent oxidoreductase [Novosphingobium piscinae]MBC2667915.1 SDR family NAD(P)-dependent oxidoreductase [Novosphingobium piscinae]
MTTPDLPASGLPAVPAFDLSGRVALLTGASSGIGAHWARLLAAAGARVVLCARRAEALDGLVGTIAAAGGEALAVATDVADETAVVAAYEAAEARFGPVDTIIANAGISGAGRAEQQPLDQFDATVAINLRGAFLTVREGARRLIAGGSAQHQRGRVVITASLAAFAVEPGLAAYSATKAAVVQMGKVMARDWARQGINVNMLCPGYIRTGINDTWFDSEAGARHIAGFHRQRLLQLTDLDVPLLWLASDLSRGVTGTALVVDDGQGL